jgi:hypothetical protein
MELAGNSNSDAFLNSENFPQQIRDMAAFLIDVQFTVARLDRITGQFEKSVAWDCGTSFQTGSTPSLPDRLEEVIVQVLDHLRSQRNQLEELAELLQLDEHDNIIATVRNLVDERDQLRNLGSSGLGRSPADLQREVLRLQTELSRVGQGHIARAAKVVNAGSESDDAVVRENQELREQNQALSQRCEDLRRQLQGGQYSQRDVDSSVSQFGYLSWLRRQLHFQYIVFLVIAVIVVFGCNL